MWRPIREFLQSERGAAGAEWAFVASILVLGSVAGLLALRAELVDRPNSGTGDAPARSTK